MYTYSYVEAIGAGFPGISVYSNGDPFVYTNIHTDSDTPIPAQATLDAWISAQIKLDVWANIQAIRDTKTAGGILLPSGYWFHTDSASRIQYLALIILGNNMPSTIMWKTMSGAFVSMTPTLIQQVFAALALSDQVIFSIAEQHRAEMLLAADPTTYDFSTGWPTIYQETL